MRRELCLAAALTVATAAAGAEPMRQIVLADCRGAADIGQCKRAHAALAKDQRLAWSGNYGAQRNLAFCLATGCSGAVVPNRVTGCAWRFVIIAAVHGEADASDIGNIVHDCGRLSPDERAAAREQAGRLFQAVFKRSFPL